ETQGYRVDAVAHSRGRRPVRKDMPLVTVAAGAAGLDADHAVALVAHRPHMRLVDRLGEAGPAGAAFELGPAAEERKAALPAAEHPRPRLAEQRPAEGRLGAVREQHPLL